MAAKKIASKKGSRVKLGKLKLTRETVKDLTAREVRKIKGGAFDKGPGGGCAKSAHVY